MSGTTATLPAAELSAIRHDLRTPVNQIVGYCELLLEDAEGEAHAARRDRIREAIGAAREVLALIEAALPAQGGGASADDVEALRQRLRGPHDRILALMDAVATEGTGADDAEALLADVGRVRHATGQLLAVRRPALNASDLTLSVTGAHATARRDAGAVGGHVLVVDDQEDNREVLARHLVRQGFQVDCAADGAAALAMAAARPYDLVLLDVRMPVLDGYEVLARLKGQPATRDLPVVMVSAADELTLIAACIEAGADDFLPKPFDPVVLRARVGASVEKHRLRRRETEYLRQVHAVVDAARAVETGTYVEGSLAPVAQRDDALGQLARVFDAMAVGVRAREARLEGQVSHLRREIEEAREREAAIAAPGLDAGTLLPGTRFAGRYHVIRVVGRGGMGTVYKAEDLELGEDVAIKLLHPESLSDDPSLAERFKSEIRLARRISHENVVRTHDVGETDGTRFVTMEYVEGITVRDLLDSRGRLPASATLGIARQLAAALAAAHAHEVVHRDIKPQNLLLDAAGTLKVMDFGIARHARRPTGVTQAGMVIGTPAYMAPEQLLAEPVDARADLYAMGVVLYECLTGRLPHDETNPIALIARVLHATPPAPATLVADVPAPLSALVLRLMAKEPDQRPPSAAALGELLAQIA